MKKTTLFKLPKTPKDKEVYGELIDIADRINAVSAGPTTMTSEELLRNTKELSREQYSSLFFRIKLRNLSPELRAYLINTYFSRKSNLLVGGVLKISLRKILIRLRLYSSDSMPS